MTNAEMVAGRYEQWARYRRMYRQITEHLASGGVVQVCTHLRATEFKAKHVECFRANQSGLYARYGRQWLCIHYCKIRFGRYA